jgi:acetyltransferase-like isoleucine patch superfamily enzyme
MAKIVIFGIIDNAELAHFYLTHDSPHEVVAFCVNEAHLPKDRTFCGLPVTPFETVESAYPPDDFKFFAPMSPAEINLQRERVYHNIKAKGYELISYVSSSATLFNNPVGDNCFILEDNTLQPFVTIGNNVILWSGNHVGHHSQIGDHSYISGRAVLGGHCVVESHCFLGGASFYRNNLRLSQGTFVSPASFITQDTDPWSVYRGNPARKSKIPSKAMRFDGPPKRNDN